MPLPSTILYPASGGGAGGSGDVVGPASSSDNAVTRFDSTTGKLIQNSAVFVGDDGVVRFGSNNSNNYGALRDKGDSSGTLELVKAANPVNTWGNLNTTLGRISAAYFSNSASGSTSTITMHGAATALQFSNAGFVAWTNNSSSEVAPLDTGLARSAPGVVKSTDGSTGIRGFIGGGTAVASATALPVPTGRVFHVTGTTNITSITSTNFQSGAVITLIFDGVLTFTDGNNLKLAGDFVTTADDTITLAYDGTNWYEVCRSVN